MTRDEDFQQLRQLQLSSVGYLLIRSAQLWNERGIGRVNADRPAFVFREAHTRMVPHLLDPAGIRITELARRLSVTKQAVGVLIAEMVDARLVRLSVDPEDGRAKLVSLTAEGARAMARGTGLLLEIEKDLARVFGKRRMRVLGQLLGELLEVMEMQGSGIRKGGVLEPAREMGSPRARRDRRGSTRRPQRG